MKTIISYFLVNIIVTWIVFFICIFFNGRTYSGNSGLSIGIIGIIYTIVIWGIVFAKSIHSKRITKLAIAINIILNLVFFTSLAITEYKEFHCLFC